MTNNTEEAKNSPFKLPQDLRARRFAVFSIIDSIGSGLVLPVTVLFFTTIVQLSKDSVAVGLSIAAAIALLCTIGVGSLIARFGPKTVLLSCLLASAGAFVGYLFISGWYGFLTLLILATAANGMTRISKQVFVASFASGAARMQLMAFQRTVRNAGYGAGSLLASLALLNGSRMAFSILFVGNALSFLISFVLIASIKLSHNVNGSEATSSRRPGGYRKVLADRRFVALALFSTPIRIHQTILLSGLAIWVSIQPHIPLAVVGFLFALNTFLVVLFQVKVATSKANLADIPELFPIIAGAMVIGCLFYATAALLPTALAIGAMTLGMVAMSLAEVHSSTAEWMISVELADQTEKARYIAFYGLNVDLERMVGPVAVIPLLTTAPIGGWAVIAGLVGLACFGSQKLVSDALTLSTHQQATAAQPSE